MTDVYEELRPLLFSIAYRMLGSATEAEDIVQEAFLRFHQAAKEEQIDNPKAYLSTITTRLSIDHLRSARVKRESYTGTWLPEPLITEQVPDVSQHAEMADSMSMAFLVLLESLSPVERAVFLLREVFDYPYEEIADTIGKSEDNTRQLAVRARRHVEERKPRFEADKKARDELAGKFWAAAEDGDTEGLVKLLADDVVFYGDGGGKGPAIAKPLYGREKVMSFFLRLMGLIDQMQIVLEPVEVNGEPGVISRAPDGSIASVLSMQIADGQIISLRSVVNPDKLGHLGPTADLYEMLKSTRS
ncbi:MAG TPA: RNA polymerase sigma-70 factor [Thermoleophilaceae bacterium]|nr:RNA polymerase sigma-70 factor [Thermoleophilaceae bacterium]